ncbi:MAG: hypothetical protein NTX25_13695 [Proteobacteria bacterium]|nr:hypothetical protein [Pseudomonadota bacterium]
MHLSSRLLSLGLMIASFIAMARPMAEELPSRSFGFGLSTVHLMQADTSIEPRYSLDLQEFERLLPWLRLNNRLGVMRDHRPRSEALSVQQHLYALQSALQCSYVKLFRYSLSAGPIALLEQTHIHTRFNQEQDERAQRWQLAWTAASHIDYAFSDLLELSVGVGWQARPSVSKNDIYWGVGLVFNSRGPGSENVILPPPVVSDE